MARLPPISAKDQVPAKDHAVFDSIVASRGACRARSRCFCTRPKSPSGVAHLGAYVRFEGSLDMRVRVLAAMTAAREFEAVYVWGAQTGGARRQGSPRRRSRRSATTIRAASRSRTRRSSSSPGPCCASTGSTMRPSRRCKRGFGNDQLIQLTTAIGYYSMLAMTVNACELEAAPDAEV